MVATTMPHAIVFEQPEKATPMKVPSKKLCMKSPTKTPLRMRVWLVKPLTGTTSPSTSLASLDDVVGVVGVVGLLMQPAIRCATKSKMEAVITPRRTARPNMKAELPSDGEPTVT